MMEKLSFLTSTRFYAIIIGAVSIYLSAKGLIGDPEMKLIATIMSGFITVRTLDRNFGDKQLESAKINSGQTNEEAKQI